VGRGASAERFAAQPHAHAAPRPDRCARPRADRNGARRRLSLRRRPMAVRHSLRLKFALSFALAGLVLVLVHAVAIHQLNRQQEAQLIDQIVSDEMEGLLEQYERQGRLDGPPYRACNATRCAPTPRRCRCASGSAPAGWCRASSPATRRARQLPEELREPGARLPRRHQGRRPLSRRSARDRQHRLLSSPTRYRCTRSAGGISPAPWRSAR
jgi:hypothetical protein